MGGEGRGLSVTQIQTCFPPVVIQHVNFKLTCPWVIINVRMFSFRTCCLIVYGYDLGRRVFIPTSGFEFGHQNQVNQACQYRAVILESLGRGGEVEAHWRLLLHI